jgi:beta-galactosidase
MCKIVVLVVARGFGARLAPQKKMLQKQKKKQKNKTSLTLHVCPQSPTNQLFSLVSINLAIHRNLTMMRYSAFICIVLLCVFSAPCVNASNFKVDETATRSFVISGQQFLRDGQPERLISGSFHYWRVHPDYWMDRLVKMRNAGLNAVQTYVPWNLHEPEQGQYVFSGFVDIVSFIQQAQAADLMVILRPGPYVCAEFEFGGLPYWLMRENPAMRIRSSDPSYLKYVDAFYAELLPRISPLLYSNGGPVVLVQVENEYGTFGSDKIYLQHLVGVLRQYLGENIVLHSTDGYGERQVEATHLGDQVYQTVDFGVMTNLTIAFGTQRKFQKTGPLMDSEFYVGWFTHWGDSHMATCDLGQIIYTLDEILRANASVNFYMFVGSTNFGYLNGANLFSNENDYHPVVTSYDYDAPIAENGELRQKYHNISALIAKYAPVPPARPTNSTPTVSYESIKATGQVNLFDAIDTVFKGKQSQTVLSFEELGQDYGFVLYRTHVQPPSDNLMIQRVRDRALVYLDKQFQGVLERNTSDPQNLYLTLSDPDHQLDILVENTGRVNFGQYMSGPQGITTGVLLGNQFCANYTIYSLPLASVTPSTFKNAPVKPVGAQNGPAFYMFTLQIDGPPSGDTYIDLTGWGKGQVWVNGFNLGRYYEIGPQHGLYLPAPLLVQGKNEIVVFELQTTTTTSVSFADHFV